DGLRLRRERRAKLVDEPRGGDGTQPAVGPIAEKHPRPGSARTPVECADAPRLAAERRRPRTPDERSTAPRAAVGGDTLRGYTHVARPACGGPPAARAR